MMVPDHIGRLHVFMIDRVVRAYYLERNLVMKVLSLAAHFLMRPG
jgi:hypothetical protein